MTTSGLNKFIDTFLARHINSEPLGRLALVNKHEIPTLPDRAVHVLSCVSSACNSKRTCGATRAERLLPVTPPLSQSMMGPSDYELHFR